MNRSDPRKNANHRERGPARYSYTITDLCELFGVHRSTIWRWRRRGLMDPRCLASVVARALRVGATG